MIPKIYPLLERCIEDGLSRGWTRAHKHTETPSEQLILDEQMNAITLEIFEWFEFKEPFEQDYYPQFQDSPPAR
jgi:hypothetical protein